jgi:uncharacterized protein DUF6644
VTHLLHICQWLAGTAIGTQIRESDNLFSVIETVHVLGITFTAGTIAIVDLRILGLLLNRYSVEEILKPLVKVAWLGFSAMVSTGFLLFWSEADKLYYNRAFRLKLTLLLGQFASRVLRESSLLERYPCWDHLRSMKARQSWSRTARESNYHSLFGYIPASRRWPRIQPWRFI